MKILMSSYAFYPSVGGIEAISAMLAAEFVERGHELRVVTCTPSDRKADFPYQVIRRPNPLKVIELVRWCDVALHINISLRTGWPLLFGIRPWVIAHQMWTAEDFRGAAKRRCMLSAHNISISQAVAEHIGVPSTLIPNPYDDELFQAYSDEGRDRELIFLGRLVSDKGVDCLLTALRLLKQKQINPRLTIVGNGPEEKNLRRMASDFGIAEQITFAGVKVGRSLASELSRHRIMVVPTVINEPFGIVALEGIASGCVVVGSSGGGLKDAIGPCGRTFPNRNASALAECLAELLSNADALSSYRKQAATHLARHTKSRVADQYLAVVHSALKSPASFHRTVIDED
jgi:glycogen synthase